MTEDTPAVETADEAFAKARKGFEVFGKPLYKYSMSRKVAADGMGLRFGFVPDDDPMYATGKYSGALRDTIIFCWLCSTPNASEQTTEQIAAKQWNVQRAQRRPDEAYAAAEQWADENGIDGIDSPRFGEAYGVFLDVMNGEGRSRFAVATTESGPVPPQDAESGN